jgi:protein TonB
VIVDFVIGLDGKVEEARVVKSVHPLLDQEAVRVIEAMDRWIPAQQGGKPVKMRMRKVVKFSRKA